VLGTPVQLDGTASSVNVVVLALLAPMTVVNWCDSEDGSSEDRSTP